MSLRSRSLVSVLVCALAQLSAHVVPSGAARISSLDRNISPAGDRVHLIILLAEQ